MSDFWTPERVERLQLLKRDKWSLGRMAADLGCSRSMVAGKVHRLSSRPTTTRVPVDWNMRKAIILDVQAKNLPIRTAALRLGVSYNTAYRIAKDHDIPFPVQTTIQGQRGTVRLPRASRPPRDRESIKGVHQAPVARVAAPVPDDAISFMDLRDGVTDLRGHFTPGTCKFELTNSEHPRDFLFCGADTTPGKPFCEIHNARCFVPVPGRQHIYASRR